MGKTGFYCNRVRFGARIKVLRVQSCKQSCKLYGIRVGRIKRFSFFLDYAYDSIAYDLVTTTLLEPQAKMNKAITMPIPCF